MILLDFFGTLVDYAPGRTEQGVEQSYALVRGSRPDLTYEAYRTGWEAHFARFDADAARTGREFSMHQVAGSFLGPDPDVDVDLFVDTYLSEWNRGVHYPDGIVDLVAGLASSHRLAVVTNTHHPSLVPDHLDAMGIADAVELVVTSVEVGVPKPAAEIYEHALGLLGVEPGSVLFVGDTFGPDYEGPRTVGMAALLIDPMATAPVPDGHRLRSIFDLPARLTAPTSPGPPRHS